MTKVQPKRNNNLPLIIGTLVVAALVALALFSGRGQNAETQKDGETAAPKFDLTNKPVVGDTAAPVEMIVLEDFKCPICKTFEEGAYAQVKNEYVDAGKVKVYSVIWPFLAEVAKLPEDDSKYAAQAAECVFEKDGADAFAQYKTIVFRAQEAETKVWATKNRLKELAGNVPSIDQAAFATCLDSDATAERVDANEEEVKANSITSTPTVFINGKRVEKPTDYASLKAAIDAAVTQ